MSSKGKGDVAYKQGNGQIEMDKVVDFFEQFLPAALYTENTIIGTHKLLQGLRQWLDYTLATRTKVGITHKWIKLFSFSVGVAATTSLDLPF